MAKITIVFGFLLILTGGTSQGKKDLTREAMRRCGARILLDAPPVIPGKTMAFGRKGSTPFFILPGNPKAIRTLYEVFVKRCLHIIAGREPLGKEQKVPLPEAFRKPGGVISLVPVLLGHREEAVARMYPAEPNGFIVLEGKQDLIPAGTLVKVLEP